MVADFLQVAGSAVFVDQSKYGTDQCSCELPQLLDKKLSYCHHGNMILASLAHLKC